MKGAKGKRHKLLFYKHTMDRFWRLSLVLTVVLWVLWWFAYLLPALQPPRDTWVLIGAGMATAVMLIALLFRNMAYVQARRDHLQLVTPFLRLKIAYRRMRAVRPVDIGQLYPPGSLNWADMRFLAPYFGKTVVGVMTNGYPLHPTLLRLFLPRHLFHPQENGFIFMVRDWMDLSTEIDSLFNTWREGQKQRPQTPSLRGLL